MSPPTPNFSAGLRSAPVKRRVLRRTFGVAGNASVADTDSSTDAGPYLRLSYATSLANIEKGLDRIEKFAESLVR